MRTQLLILKRLIAGKTGQESLALLAERFRGKIVFSTSFSLEDQIITHIIFSNNLPIKIFTLDTGRLFPETYSIWNRTKEKYEKRVEAYYPNEKVVQKMVSEKGPNCFYESKANRLECCHIRKVEPLSRALSEKKIWITGIRGEHSENRQKMQNLEWDKKNQIIKFHPLFEWSGEEVWRFIRAENILYNSLHDRGFPSIGCQPCTRAVQEGEDPRAGRWWWEKNDKKECGLHLNK